MNLELDNDPLDEALRSRRAIAPPSRFTDHVLARVRAEGRLSTVEDAIAACGVRAGIAAAAFGVWLAVDIEVAAAKLTDAVQTPDAAPVMGIVAICLAWALMRREPEGEAL